MYCFKNSALYFLVTVRCTPSCINNTPVFGSYFFTCRMFTHKMCIRDRYNASLQDAKGLAALLTSLSIQRVQLLPFHQFGKKKYEMLNRDYEMKHKKALYPEDLRDYQQIFLNQGIDCFF